MPENQNRAERANESNSVSPGMVLRRQLLQCMAETLTPRQYQVFVLNFLEGMPQVEITRELGISPSSVSRHMLWAKERMRCAMGYEFAPYESDPDDPELFPDEPYPVSLPGWVVSDYSA